MREAFSLLFFLVKLFLVALLLLVVVLFFFRNSNFYSEFTNKIFFGENKKFVVSSPDLPVPEIAVLVVKHAVEKQERTDRAALWDYYFQAVRHKFKAMVVASKEESPKIQKEWNFKAWAGQFWDNIQTQGLKEAFWEEISPGEFINLESFLSFEEVDFEESKKLSGREKQRAIQDFKNELFTIADQNQDGVLHVEEYVNLYRQKGWHMEFAQLFDENNNNTIEKKEVRSAEFRYGMK